MQMAKQLGLCCTINSIQLVRLHIGICVNMQRAYTEVSGCMVVLK